MEVIFPWERDDIIVRSTAEESSDDGGGGAAFASMLTSIAAEADNEARIRTLADGVRTVVDSSEMSAEEVLVRIESELDAEE